MARTAHASRLGAARRIIGVGFRRLASCPCDKTHAVVGVCVKLTGGGGGGGSGSCCSDEPMAEAVMAEARLEARSSSSEAS